MIGAEMMITVQREKSFSTATRIPSRTAIPSAIFSRRWASHLPVLLGLGCTADSLTAATYHAFSGLGHGVAQRVGAHGYALRLFGAEAP
jgi:hypothetical protein